MYLNIGEGNALGLGNIGSFVSAKYWSSTEKDDNKAWTWEFGSGYQESNSKTSNKYVRAVRSFSNLVSLNEHETFIVNKNLIKVVDVLGRESKMIKNQILYYIYGDGAVEKKMILEQ